MERDQQQPATSAKESPPVAMVMLFALLFIVALVVALVWGASLAPFSRQMIIIVSSAFLALALWYGTSRATATGSLWGLTFRFSGTGALFLVTYFTLIFVVPKPDTQNVRVYLDYQKAPLARDFDATIRVRRMELQKKKGHEGEVAFELPSHITEIDNLTIDCPGYRVLTDPPYKIEDGAVRIEMVKSQSPPPVVPGGFPSPSVIPDIPPNEPPDDSSLVEPDRVTLHYRNRTARPIKLFLFDVSRYHKIKNGKIAGAEPWLVFPMDASDQFTPFNRFESGTGWYCFVVLNDNKEPQFLGCRNLYTKEETFVSIEETSNGLRATFGKNNASD